jgi:hypothetical protein
MTPSLPNPPRFANAPGPVTDKDWMDLYRWFNQIKNYLSASVDGNLLGLLQPIPDRGVPVNELTGLLALLFARPAYANANSSAFGLTRQYFAVTVGQTTFTPTVSPAANCLVVLNGDLQEAGSGADYQIVGASIVFNNPLLPNPGEAWTVGVIQ